MLGNTDRWMTAYRTFCGKNSPEKAGGNFPVPPESGTTPNIAAGTPAGANRLAIPAEANSSAAPAAYQGPGPCSGGFAVFMGTDSSPLPLWRRLA